MIKGLLHKLVKVERTVVVDDANLAKYATAIYDVIGHRCDAITFDRVWRIGGQEWLLRFMATGAQVDEIRNLLRNS